MPEEQRLAMEKRADRRARRVALLSWVLVAVFYFNLSYDYIRVSINNGRFVEYMQYVVQIAGAEDRPPSEVRQLLLRRAQELDLPIESPQIRVLGSGATLNVTVDYQVEIQIPLFDRGIYNKQFLHRAQYKRLNG